MNRLYDGQHSGEIDNSSLAGAVRGSLVIAAHPILGSDIDNLSTLSSGHLAADRLRAEKNTF